MTTKYYVDQSGIYLGGFSEANPDIPPSSVEVPSPPPCSGYSWNGASWIDTKPHLISSLAEIRYNKEVGGISLSGLPIRTDDRSKGLISGKYAKIINEDPALTFLVKLSNSFITITNAQMVSIFLAVNAHVQKCFDCEAATLIKINDDTLTTAQAVEDYFNAQYIA